jgi:hypothetical protein
LRGFFIVVVLTANRYGVVRAFGQSTPGSLASNRAVSIETASVGKLNGILYVDGHEYACSGTGLQAAIIAAGSQGVVDARGCNPGSAVFASTITIPANVTVYLGPYTWVCGVASAPCWALTGNGARLIGYYAGSQDEAPSSQTATILRMGAGITSTTDMVSINAGATAGNIAAVEVGRLTIDFANTLANTGRYGLFGDSMNRSKIHDILIYDAGSDGVHFQTDTATHSYENTLDTIYVRVAGGDGFQWTTATTAGSYDFDRWRVSNCSYMGYNFGDTTTRFGNNGFNLVTGTSSVEQGIRDFSFDRIWVGGVVNGGSGFVINQSGTASVGNISVSGDLEDDYNANSGTGFKVKSSDARHVTMVEVNVIFYNYATVTNLDTSTATGYSIRQDGVHLVRTDGFQFLPTTLPVSPTYNPVGGVTWQSSNGDYLWAMTSDGVIHVVRTDTGPVEEWRFDQAKNRIYPAADKTGSLGIPTNRWERISTVKLDIASVASLKTAAGISDIVKVPGATPFSHCSLTATNASAAANIVTTYISAKEANQITVRHAPISGMSYDVVCTSN